MDETDTTNNSIYSNTISTISARSRALSQMQRGYDDCFIMLLDAHRLLHPSSPIQFMRLILKLGEAAFFRNMLANKIDGKFYNTSTTSLILQQCPIPLTVERLSLHPKLHLLAETNYNLVKHSDSQITVLVILQEISRVIQTRGSIQFLGYLYIYGDLVCSYFEAQGFYQAIKAKDIGVNTVNEEQNGRASQGIAQRQQKRENDKNQKQQKKLQYPLKVFYRKNIANDLSSPSVLKADSSQGQVQKSLSPLSFK